MVLMKKEYVEQEIERRLNQLSDEKKSVFRDAYNYIRSAPVSDKKADKMLIQLLDEWLYAEKEGLAIDLTKKTINDYCQKRLAHVPEASIKLKVAWALRGCFMVFCVIFFIHIIIQFIGIFDNSVQTTAFSFLPFFLLGIFGLFGVYLIDIAKKQKRTLLWKSFGFVFQFVGIVLFLASMRFWDSVLKVDLTLPLAIFLLIPAVAGVYLLGRWKEMLEREEEKRDSDDVRRYSAGNPPH